MYVAPQIFISDFVFAFCATHELLLTQSATASHIYCCGRKPYFVLYRESTLVIVGWSVMSYCCNRACLQNCLHWKQHITNCWSRFCYGLSTKTISFVFVFVSYLFFPWSFQVIRCDSFSILRSQRNNKLRLGYIIRLGVPNNRNQIHFGSSSCSFL